MKKLALCLALACVVSASACDNFIAKKFGGSMTVQLPIGQKLVTASWKDTDLWYLTRPMREGEWAETSVLQESSTHGILNGKVMFVEQVAPEAPVNPR
jgi:hypothetical protein